MRPDDKRGAVEPCGKDRQPRLGLGPDQNRPDAAAVTHRQLVCCADARLTHLRIERDGAQDQRTRTKAADLSTAAAQDHRRGLLWEDLLTDVSEKRHGPPVIENPERLRIGQPAKSAST